MTTYKAIQHQEVGAGGAASITFSNIPQTYTDLYLVVSARNNNSSYTTNGTIALNGSSTGYSDRLLYGTGSSAASASTTGSSFAYANIINAANSTASTFNNTSIYLPNYTSSNYKSLSADSIAETNDSTNARQYLNAGLWSNTSAITSITINATSGNFVQYSSATLYGITRAALPTPTDVYSDSLLEEVVLTSSAASVTFSGLAAYAALGYTNLQIRAVARTLRALTDDAIQLTLNGSTTGSMHFLWGNGTSVSTQAVTNEPMQVAAYSLPAANSPANVFGASIIDFLDAFDSSKNTTVRALSGKTSDTSVVSLNSAAWYNTASLTSIKLDSRNGNNGFAAGTRFSLYGSK